MNLGLIYKNNRIFIAAFFRLIIILFITSIATFVIYEVSLSLLEKSLIDRETDELAKKAQIFEHRFNELDSSLHFIANNPQVQYFLSSRTEFLPRDIWTLNELRDMLSLIDVTNNFIDYLFIFFSTKNIIVSNSISETRLDLFFEYSFHVEDRDNKLFLENLNSPGRASVSPLTTVFINDIRKNKILIKESLPPGRIHDPGGVLFFCIDEETILDLLGRDSLFPMSITDNYGNMIYEYNPENRFPQHRNDKTISFFLSDRNLIFNCTIPTQYIKEWLVPLKKTFVIIMSLFLLIGITISFFISYRSSKPLINIMKELVRTGTISTEDTQDLSLIGDSLKLLATRESRLKNTINSQIPLMKFAFYEKLLNGDYQSMNQLHEHSRQLNINIDSDFYLPMIISFSGLEDGTNYQTFLEILRVLLGELYLRDFVNQIYTHNMKGGAMILILCLNKDDVKQNITEIINPLLEEIESKTKGVILSLGAGITENDPLLLYKSFEKCREAYFYAQITRSNTIIWWEDEQKKRKQEYIYTLANEKKILNLFYQDLKEDLKNYVHNLFMENFERGGLNSKTKEHFIEELRGTLVKVLQRISHVSEEERDFLKEKIQTMNVSLSPLELEESFIESLEVLHPYITKSKKSKNRILLQNLLLDLEEELGNPDLSLSFFSKKYHRTESYLSQFFKEQMGEGYVGYIESRRMEKITDDMKNTDEAIIQIIERHGYRQKNTFYKAFKRNYGMSPQNYRDQFRLNRN